MKKVLVRLLPWLGSALALVAVIGVKPTCFGALYQPEVPARLRED
ncbi:MAG: cyclic lactone autoinducer peptide [Moorellales bacterium]